MTVFDDADAVLHRDTNLVTLCSYVLASGGPPIPDVSMIVAAPDRELQVGRAGLVTPDITASVLVGALPAPPVAGDLVLIGDVAHTVSRAERNTEGTSWRLYLRPDPSRNVAALRLANAAL